MHGYRLLCFGCVQDLEERMKKLLNSPPLVEDNSEENMIKNIGWVQGDDELYQYIKVGRRVRKT